MSLSRPATRETNGIRGVSRSGLRERARSWGVEFLGAARASGFDSREQRASLAAREWDAKAATGRLLPILSARGAYTHNQYEAGIPAGTFPGQTSPLTITPRDQLDGTLQLDVPIIDLAAWSRRSQAQHLARAEEASQEVTFNNAIFDAYHRLNASIASSAAARAQVEAARRADRHRCRRVQLAKPRPPGSTRSMKHLPFRPRQPSNKTVEPPRLRRPVAGLPRSRQQSDTTRNPLRPNARIPVPRPPKSPCPGTLSSPYWLQPGMSYLTPKQLVDNGALLLDVRSPEEFADGHLPGAVNVPLDALETWLQSLRSKARDSLPEHIVVYCRSGRRSALAKLQLVEQGFSVTDIGTMSSFAA